MIKDILKGLLKWIFWILILLLLGAIILAFRIFVLDKDYKGDGKIISSSKSSDSSSSSKPNKNGSSSVTDTVSTSDSNGSSDKLSSFGQKVVNGAKTLGNATVRGYMGDSEYNYNVYNFDEWFLMYEGEQYEGNVNNILEHLIENSNGTFYARTTVTSVGFGGDTTISYEGDVVEYQNRIKELESAVTGGMYDVSFKYAGIMTYVNEIVITKK